VKFNSNAIELNVENGCFNDSNNKLIGKTNRIILKN